MKKAIRIIWYRFFGFLFRIFPIRNNRIVFSSFFGKGFGDNSKYIAEELLCRNGFELIWMVKKNIVSDFPDGIKVVKRGSLAELYYLSTAKIWVDNSRKPYGLLKRKGQYYIQTWHSSLRLKKIEADADCDLDKKYIKAAKNDSKMIDLITSGCHFSTNIYKNSFWYDGEVFECGSPRCDMLLNEKKKTEMREKIIRFYNIDSKKKLVLYAPTFRKNKEDESFYLNLEEFAKKLGDKYLVLARMHPISTYRIAKNNNVLDVTEYPDMQELICAVDCLITDYSGCCFDMMIAKKPCILYTPDLQRYLSKERDLYFSFDELPFEKITSVDELAYVIKRFDIKNYLKKVEIFDKKIGLCEKGNASKTIADIIAEKCWGKNEQK